MANRPLEQRRGPLPAAQVIMPTNPFLGLLPKRYWKRVKDFFVYSFEYLPINASATTTQTVQIQGDADFVAMAGVRTVFATDNTTVVANPPFLVELSDTGSGRKIMDKAVHIENLFGTGQLPAIWPFPKLFRASSSFSIQVQSLDGVNNRNVRLSVLGFKVFAMEEGA